MNISITTYARFLVLLLVSTFSLSGCSGSGSDQISENSMPSIADDGISVISDENPSELPIGSNPPGDGAIVSDPLVQNFTQVNFEITVPAYASNALNVQLVWGAKNLVATWIGDEFWTASDLFPTNAKQPLIVSFTDVNGDITLGQLETDFKTGTSASETYVILAEQFNTSSWDSDNDGISNLDESIAGTNPLLDESVALEVRESFGAGGKLAFRAAEIESMIGGTRPFNLRVELLPEGGYTTDRTTHIVTIDLDGAGTGTVSDEYRFAEQRDIDVTTRNQYATRTNTGSSIIWMGSYYRYNSSAAVRDESEYTIETTDVDALTRFQSGTIKTQGSPYSDNNRVVSYSLTGTPIQGSAYCEPATGTYVNEVDYSYAYSGAVVSTVSKAISNDPYWTVTVTTVNGQVLEEYLVNALGLTFFCDLADL